MKGWVASRLPGSFVPVTLSSVQLDLSVGCMVFSVVGIFFSPVSIGLYGGDSARANSSHFHSCFLTAKMVSKGVSKSRFQALKKNVANVRAVLASTRLD